jgi:hypothetical protein
MSSNQSGDGLSLAYTIICDDVRLEAGNKLSLMGVFQNIGVEQLPVSLIKLAVVSHWRGAGSYLSEVRILSPDRQHFVAASQPARFQIEPGGFADSVTMFVNVTFPHPGQYWVQTLVDSNLFDEQPLVVAQLPTLRAPESASEAVN